MALPPINRTSLTAAKTAVVAANGLRSETANRSASYIMSALGRPGYGRAFSEAAIVEMAATRCSVHRAVDVVAWRAAQ